MTTLSLRYLPLATMLGAVFGSQTAQAANYYTCDCDADADADCIPGDDNSSGTAPNSPW